MREIREGSATDLFVQIWKRPFVVFINRDRKRSRSDPNPFLLREELPRPMDWFSFFENSRPKLSSPFISKNVGETAVRPTVVDVRPVRKSLLARLSRG